MLFFNKKVDENIINELENIMNTYSEEMDKCFLPTDAQMVWYLEGNDLLDNIYKKELDNFDLDILFNRRNISLPECLEKHYKVRKSFFFAINNIKQNKNLYYNNSLCEFLKENGKFFINNYLKNFSKSAKSYKRKLISGKLPDYKELCMWIQNDKLYFIDRLFVYLHNYAIKLDDIVGYYKDEDTARTILKFKEDNIVKSMNFNLTSFYVFKNVLPFKELSNTKDC